MENDRYRDRDRGRKRQRLRWSQSHTERLNVKDCIFSNSENVIEK